MKIICMFTVMVLASTVLFAQRTTITEGHKILMQNEDGKWVPAQYDSNGTLIRKMDSPPAEHRYPVYVDLATILLVGNISLNVEIPVADQFLFRLGYGSGWVASGFQGDVTSSGLLTMMNFVPGDGDYRFEFGLGGSIIKRSDWENSNLLPAITLGSRYQPGRFLFRFGLGYTYSFGTPVYFSIGAVI